MEEAKILKEGYGIEQNQMVETLEIVNARACLKIHSCHLHAPLRGIFAPNSVSVARYAAFICNKSPTKCDVHLAESNFQTHSRTDEAALLNVDVDYPLIHLENTLYAQSGEVTEYSSVLFRGVRVKIEIKNTYRT